MGSVGGWTWQGGCCGQRGSGQLLDGKAGKDVACMSGFRRAHRCTRCATTSQGAPRLAPVARVACRGVLWGVASATGHYCRRGPHKVEKTGVLVRCSASCDGQRSGSPWSRPAPVTWPSWATAWGQQSLRWVKGRVRLLVASSFDRGPRFKESTGPQSSVLIISCMPPGGGTEESYSRAWSPSTAWGQQSPWVNGGIHWAGGILRDRQRRVSKLRDTPVPCSEGDRYTCPPWGPPPGHRMASNKARARQQVGGIVSVASWGLATGSHNSSRLSQVSAWGQHPRRLAAEGG